MQFLAGAAMRNMWQLRRALVPRRKRQPSGSCRAPVAIFVAACLWQAFAAAEEPTAFATRLESLATRCEELDLPEEARLTRGWMIPRFPGRQYLFLPLPADALAPKSAADEVARKWYAKFREIRAARAAELFGEARQSLAANRPARAYQLVHEVLREDPDHAEARRILGYVRKGNGPWMLPETERLQAELARTAHPKLGWPARSYWRLETPHFEIVTNHSAKEALEAGRLLEDVQALWRQMFFRYWSNQAALEARFAGGQGLLAPERPRMKVVLFRSREEYVARLTPMQPQIGVTLGIYLDEQRTSYFYAGDTSVYPTWQHEAAHQLFQEAVPGTIERPGERQNFWALEGVALYLESLKRGHSTFRQGCWTAGGCEADRLQFARYRALAGDFNLPLAQLAALGREELQASADLRKLYAEAAGVAQFLIDGESGRYREPFIDLLTLIYRGEDAADSLAKTTGIAYPALDEQYRGFLNVADDDLAGIPDVASIQNLSLGRTTITDAGVAHLADARNLQWLDLSLTATTNEGLKLLASATALQQLFLEGSKITDASLPVIGGFKHLEELDLSNLAITDDGLAALASLKNLKILYLTNSPVTDAGLQHLRSLKRLEQLETSGTQITPEGLAGLKGSLPKLK